MNRNLSWVLTLGLLGLTAKGWAQEQAPVEPPPMDDEKEVQVIEPSEGESAEMDEESALPAEEIPAESEAAAEPSEPRTMPEVYQIQTGDTLWDICQKFLDNPWYWPKLWSLNQYIENPHLIFPGNQVVFRMGSETATPRMDVLAPGEAPPEEIEVEAEVAAPEERPMTATAASMESPVTSRTVRLKADSSIFERKPNVVGYISHSGDQKQNLSFGDRVYVKFNRKRQVSVGDLFHVIEKVKKVKDPGSFFGLSLGTLVKKKAAIRVVGLHKSVVEALIVDNIEPVKRGDEFIPYESTIRSVTPHEAGSDVKGEIVEADNQQYMIGGNEYVFVNLGKKQGISDGTRLLVVRSGDGVFSGADSKLPDVVVGRLLVVQAGNHSSTAYVTDLRDSLEVGDRVRGKL